MLGANDRSALLLAHTAITKLEAANVPKSLRWHVENLKQSLLDAGTYLINPHHPICMVGHIGVGKSTAGNAIFGLTEGFGKHRRRSKEPSADQGLLPTGGGGATAFEFKVAYAHEPSIRIEPRREDKILTDVRELCEFWVAEARGEKRERWTLCASRWGQGPGFRSDIAGRIENWFEHHPRVSARLENHLQAVWDDNFISWLHSYIVKA